MKKTTAFLSVLIFASGAFAGQPKISKQGVFINHITSGDWQAVSVELDSGMPPNFTTGSINETPLTLAALNGRAKITETLLRHKANINAQTKNGMTALMFAATGQIKVAPEGNFEKPNYPEVIKILLGNGADTGIKNNQGQTALDMAKKAMRSPEIISLLSP